jgi:uncharacterized protein (TIGR02246 family)
MLLGWSWRPALAQDSLAAQWAALWSAKKLDAVMRLYVADPIFLPSVGARWQGREELRKNFKGLLAHYNPQISLLKVSGEASGDLAFETGAYDETITPVDGGKPIAARGGYLFVYRRGADGVWNILEQSWTSEEPPPKL